MKHTLKITALLLLMFLMTQFIGLYVATHYLGEGNNLPYGLEFPKAEKESDYYGFFTAIIIAFIIAIVLFLFFAKIKIEFMLKLWFFVVVLIALSISIFSLTRNFDKFLFGMPIIALLVALPLTIIKIYRKNFLVHNLTELMIYPGIAVIFIPILNIYTIIALLILISIYDIWAVWHSGIMQKMAKYQMEELHIFGSFLIPSMSKKDKEKLKNIKQKYKDKKIPMKMQKKKFKVNLAILGGGDVIFPIITAGVFMWSFPSQALFGIAGLIPALFIISGALAGLIYLFIQTQKGKAYPAMPYITTGIFLGLILWKIFI